MTENEIIFMTHEFIHSFFKSDTSGHDYYHSFRVYQLATKIAQKENSDLFIVQISALLHDVDDEKFDFGNTKNKNARQFLNSINLPTHQINTICHIIKQISFKGTDSIIPDSIEGKIVQDADRLDALGAIGIARAFTYGGSTHRNIYIPNQLPLKNLSSKDYYAHTSTTINHFYEKLLLLKDSMNTTEGKRIAEHRHSFMELYLTEFFEEWNSTQ